MHVPGAIVISLVAGALGSLLIARCYDDVATTPQRLDATIGWLPAYCMASVFSAGVLTVACSSFPFSFLVAL